MSDRAEVEALRAALDQQRWETAFWQAEADAARRALERFRLYRPVQAAAAVSSAARTGARRVRDLPAPGTTRRLEVAIAQLRAAVSALPPPGDARATDAVVLRHPAVAPLTEDWRDRLLAALGEPGVVAAGAQLVRADRGALSVVSRGLAFPRSGDGIPTPAPMGAGTAVEVAKGSLAVPALPDGCVAIERAAFQAVGGLDGAFRAGLQVADLCLRLVRNGGRVVVVPGAVALDRRPLSPTAQIDADLRLLLDRWGPVLAPSASGPRYGLRTGAANREVAGFGVSGTSPRRSPGR